MEDRKLEVGSAIVFITEHRARRNALVTHVWSGSHGNMGGGSFEGCNLVLVDPDESKEDPYGRQIARRTSVVHLSAQPAKAGCWCWPDEG